MCVSLLQENSITKLNSSSKCTNNFACEMHNFHDKNGFCGPVLRRNFFDRESLYYKPNLTSKVCNKQPNARLHSLNRATHSLNYHFYPMVLSHTTFAKAFQNPQKNKFGAVHMAIRWTVHVIFAIEIESLYFDFMQAILYL